jgi:3-deoxy-D-manno-octulosonic-acid transferase
VVILETEIWPHLWRETRRSGARLVVVNGRISDRALPRYRRFRLAVRPGARAAAPGAHAERAGRRALSSTWARQAVNHGNLKYDLDPARMVTPPAVAAAVAGAGKILVVASTHCEDIDEDDAVIAAWPRWVAEFPDLVMILAPRKPERFDAVARKLEAAGIAFRRRSEGRPVGAPGVLLLDSLGELSGVVPVGRSGLHGRDAGAARGTTFLKRRCWASPWWPDRTWRVSPNSPRRLRPAAGCCGARGRISPR